MSRCANPSADSETLWKLRVGLSYHSWNTYQIYSVRHDACLKKRQDSTHVYLGPCRSDNGSFPADGQWTLNTDLGLGTVRFVNGDRCLGWNRYLITSDVLMVPCGGGPPRWQLVPADDVQVRSVNSGKCWELTGTRVGGKRQILQRTCDADAPEQRFTLRPQEVVQPIDEDAYFRTSILVDGGCVGSDVPRDSDASVSGYRGDPLVGDSPCPEETEWYVTPLPDYTGFRFLTGANHNLAADLKSTGGATKENQKIQLYSVHNPPRSNQIWEFVALR